MNWRTKKSIPRFLDHQLWSSIFTGDELRMDAGGPLPFLICSTDSFGRGFHANGGGRSRKKSGKNTERPSRDDISALRRSAFDCRSLKLFDSGRNASQRFSWARISGSRTSAQSPANSNACTLFPANARSRIASVSSYSPRGDRSSLAINSKMLERKA